jgi:hypothetical protein
MLHYELGTFWRRNPLSEMRMLWIWCAQSQKNLIRPVHPMTAVVRLPLRCNIQFLLLFTTQSTGQVQKCDFDVFQFQYLHITPQGGLCLVHTGFLGWRVGKWYRVLPVPARSTSEMWHCCHKNVPQLLHERFPLAGMAWIAIQFHLQGFFI